MKILLIGSDYHWSIERIYKKELLKLGHDVKHIPVQNWYYDHYYKSTVHKIITRLGLSTIQRRIQERTKAEIGNEQFDLVWVFKGMELTPKTIIHLGKSTRRLINFNPDNPFIFSGKGSGNKNVSKSIPLFDEHFTYDHQVKVKIESEFGIKCTLVPFGYDPEAITIEELNEVDEILAVCFVGNPDAYRTQVLREILENGLPLHLYGHDWSKYLNHPNLIIHDPVYEKEYYRTLRKYRVQLNIMRVHNLESHNMRSIEVPGCGGIMLAPRTKDHEAFFEEGKDAFFYKDTIELISKANDILKMEDSKIQKMQTQVREKILNSYNYSILTLNFISI
jgi:hypothetical protein